MKGSGSFVSFPWSVCALKGSIHEIGSPRDRALSHWPVRNESTSKANGARIHKRTNFIDALFKQLEFKDDLLANAAKDRSKLPVGTAGACSKPANLAASKLVWKEYRTVKRSVPGCYRGLRQS